MTPSLPSNTEDRVSRKARVSPITLGHVFSCFFVFGERVGQGVVSSAPRRRRWCAHGCVYHPSVSLKF